MMTRLYTQVSFTGKRTSTMFLVVAEICLPVWTYYQIIQRYRSSVFMDQISQKNSTLVKHLSSVCVYHEGLTGGCRGKSCGESQKKQTGNFNVVQIWGYVGTCKLSNYLVKRQGLAGALFQFPAISYVGAVRYFSVLPPQKKKFRGLAPLGASAHKLHQLPVCVPNFSKI